MMFGFSIPWGKAIIGLALIAVLAVGFFYIRALRAENAQQKMVIDSQANTIRFFREAAQIDQETLKRNQEVVNEAVKSGDPQRIYDMYYRLRGLSTGQPDKGK